MLAGILVDKTWASIHATETHYVKWALNTDSRAQGLAVFLLWRVSLDAQRKVWKQLMAANKLDH